jgi:hypothetical protein
MALLRGTYKVKAVFLQKLRAYVKAKEIDVEKKDIDLKKS